MSIASDLRSYADQAVSQAQAQLNGVTGQANDLYGKTKDNVADIAAKATEAVTDLRAQAEKAVNLDAIKSAIEPYLAQVREYTTSVTDRAEALLSGVTSDQRVAKLVDAAGSVSGVVVETVQVRVVKPVQSLTGIGNKPAAKPAASAAAKPTSKRAVTKPVATKRAATKPASKPTARKAPAKRATKA